MIGRTGRQIDVILREITAVREHVATLTERADQSSQREQESRTETAALSLRLSKVERWTWKAAGAVAAFAVLVEPLMQSWLHK